MTDASTTPTSRRRIGVALSVATVAVAVGAAALIGLPGAASSADAGAAAPPPATPVSVATVAEREISAFDEYSGRLEAVQRVDVRSRVAGAVQSIHFREGALVKSGDLLVTIDPAPYAAEVDRASAEVAAAQARLVFARSELARSQRLWDDKAIAERELDERRNAGAEADARLRAATAALQTARLNLGYTQVRAPVAGRIGRVEITVGNLVAAGPGSPVLTTLVSVSPIYASFDADEQALDRTGARAAQGAIAVRMGTAGQADTPYTGRLQLVDNQVDARSGTVRVRAVFDNADGSLTPGQFARIRMGHSRTSNALLVSERAVGTDQSKKYVMVIGPDNKAEYREVRLGGPIDGLRIVDSGLKAGERIVVNGLQRVRPGSLVAPQEVPMQQARADAAARPS
ncbi:efflux RND transporter periplasmic adaptor subunit [Xylophilus sp. GOD-11R]|uniref:efflux RND transporter periplasmic adaptor subunit n=1 Tax=Xylophilus sp. GOD-11R TaxID=3089814 RepID=UPI00298CEAC6|nr:efflux RND transporter periplasmic adaptor subunit [Xylophilus sp. GOD-11R]WPB55267.1 efflux RND transporter periplasmic adaptor subunit [Xylophilus sp. GOD-11R]